MLYNILIVGEPKKTSNIPKLIWTLTNILLNLSKVKQDYNFNLSWQIQYTQRQPICQEPYNWFPQIIKKEEEKAN